MKKTTIIFTLILSIIISSCQKEESPIVDDTANLKTEIFTDNLSRSNSGPNVLEANLKWTSFMMAFILRNNQDIYNHVEYLLQNGDNVITLNELLGTSTINFEEAVIDWVASEYLGHPDLDPARPDPPIQGFGGGRSIPADQFADLFIEYLTQHNCVELYFPKSINFSYPYSITTTGHPTNQDNFNDGILIKYYPTGEIDNSDPHVTVTQNYVNSYNNIIVARPYRASYGGSGFYSLACSYSVVYSGIDFTDFLNGTSGPTGNLGL